MNWLTFTILLTLSIGCAGDGDKGESDQEPLPTSSTATGGAANVSGVGTIPEQAEAVWGDEAVSISKLANDVAKACRPNVAKPNATDLGDRIYNKSSGKIIQKVYCNSHIELDLNAIQSRELEATLSSLHVVTVRATSNPTVGCQLATSTINTWQIVDADGPRTFFTSPTSNCADSKVLRGTESVNSILERFLRQAGKIQ